jgi:hypothetical protein
MCSICGTLNFPHLNDRINYFLNSSSIILFQVEGTPVTVGVGGGLAGPGYSFMLSTDTAGLVWEALLDAGAVPMGSKAWEQIRVWQGRLTLLSCD